MYIANTYIEAERAVERMILSGPLTLGFDTETTIEREEDKGKVSVIQLHTGSACYIFQVYRIWKNEGTFPSKLGKFLTNPHYIKVGVAADNDARMIERSYGVRVAGVIDIQYIARSMKIAQLSMEGLASRFVPTIHKGKKGNVWTNWDNDLDSKHINYASTDAMLSLLIYKGIFPEIVPNGDEYVFDIIEEDRLLYDWLLSRGSIPTKSVVMLSNLIANSYGRWARIYSLQERTTLAEQSLMRMIDSGYSIEHDRYQDDVLNLISHQFGIRRKKESIINQLCNSYSALAKYDPIVRRIKAEELVNTLVQEGKILYRDGYYYLS